MTATDFAIGSLVTARGRDWVVLPESVDDFLVAKPLGGSDAEITGLIPAVEEVTAATFPPPSPSDRGDDRSGRMLREALRIGFRSSGGPFRSLASLNVDPRPYQLVPLLLGLRQETVRMLIADDVGIGKTVEAGLVASELLAQGTVQRMSVLCPPSLAEQWRAELSEKFGLDAQLVLPSTVTRLERSLAVNESLFQRYPITIVSLDFIKSERHRHEFQRTAPELIIVDEAHTVAADDSGTGSAGRTQRYNLIRALADDRDRHLILTTATPHSGNDGAFRNLIGLLDNDLKAVDLTSESGRRLLARHMVQRRRGDIRDYLGAETQFPKDRQTSEAPYQLSGRHKEFFDDVLEYIRGQVQDRSGTKLQQRVRWWSALALLRAMASSPAAAAMTLRTRAATTEAQSAVEADVVGAAEVLDQFEDEGADAADLVPGAEHEASEASLLRSYADRADDLVASPADDAKLTLLTTQVKALVKDGFSPIVFCRFIQTAKYVHQHLAGALGKIEVEVVTGELPSEERAARIAALAERTVDAQRVLVATDCLSEGVNLQSDFQAVVHYDLAWNPTRHEQREGRVDRFGQPREIVRAQTIYGADNGIDGIVLDVLIRKHDKIRRDLGISVPVPAQSDEVLSALLEGAVMRGNGYEQLTFDFDLEDADVKGFDAEWESSAEKEKQSQTMFAQRTIRPDEVKEAMDAARRSLGEPGDVSGFVADALTELGALLTTTHNGFTADLSQVPVQVVEALTAADGRPITDFRGDLPAPRRSAVLQRTDPTVAALANYVLNSALDGTLVAKERPAKRAGILTTDAVSKLTTALLMRFRTHLVLPAKDRARTTLAEEARVVAFRGRPSDPEWLSDDEVEQLLSAKPTANTPVDVAENTLGAVVNAIPAIQSHLSARAEALAAQLEEDHVSVRVAARGERAGALSVRGLSVRAQLPPDVLGVYVYRPAGGAA
ncbi:helicase-related protein [Microbacterium hatanonis]|uniref:DEAD/DEAH box helicase n=1 Tax=Microbacterium hatanonis TaxID=404366 RepID=A0A5C8I210_9MICO|nr:helicase-related protein [Microbacterium hatanonis]TXK12369.1 DEAD/DEAH box helicase [Microbacterium hatanonis]